MGGDRVTVSEAKRRRVLQRGTAGLLLGFVALRSRSLLAPMFAHAAFNAVVLAPGFGP